MLLAKNIVYYAAAGTTAIAGILHLIMSPMMLNFNPNGAILFIVGGIAQIFWVVPMIKKWGIPWYLIGIGGTIVLIAIWVITRMPDNPITGRGGGVNEMAIAVEAMQVAFIGLTAAIIAMEAKAKMIDRKSSAITDSKGKRI